MSGARGARAAPVGVRDLRDPSLDRATQRAGARARAIVPAAIAACLVMILGSLYGLGYSDRYMALLTAWGADPFKFPFVDTHAVLSAIECHRRGIDVYVENPCDVLGRVHVYSPLWLWGSILPITTGWTPAIGLASVALFLLSLTLLPPGRGWWQTAVISLGTISSMVAFAVERANIDLVIFVLAVLMARLLQHGRALRLIGYGVALLAGLLKFYPFALFLLATRERLVAFVAIAALAAAALAGFAALYAHELGHVLSSIPAGSYFSSDIFGARDLPYGLAHILGWPDRAASGLLIALTLGMTGYAAVLVRRGDLLARIDGLSGGESACLMIGSLLLLGCFFTAQNFLYRGIHFLFVLPGLTALMRRPGERLNGALVLGCALVLLLMWGETIRLMIDPALRQLGLPLPYVEAVNERIWAVRELVWWAVATMLATLLMALLLRSRVALELAARWSLSRRRAGSLRPG